MVKALKGILPLVAGVGIVTVIEPFINVQLEKFGLVGMIDDILKLGIGYFLAKRKSGYVKGAGIALMVLGTNRLVGKLMSGTILGSTAASSGW